MWRVRQQVNYSEELINKYCTNKVTIAFLDTGIGRHPDLTGNRRLLAFRDFVHGHEACYDDSGHGTHVSGIACGNGLLSAGYYKGIAERADLVVGKVLNRKGDGRMEDMVKGLEWVMQNRRKYRIRVLNISMGIGDLKEKERETILLDALREVCNAGIIVVCAAGNTGPGEGSISVLGSLEDVITVGCHDGEYLKDKIKRCETYSGRGSRLERVRKPDVVAPGTDIVSCDVKCHKAMNGYVSTYITKSGTSMATPIVAGAAALLVQKEPMISASEVKRKILYSAVDLGEHWTKQGWGMLNIAKMIED